MSDKKSLCAKISVELHEKVSAEKEQSGLTLNEYVELLLTEYYEIKKGGKMMSDTKMRTLAIQIPEELMDKVKVHLKNTGMTQKAFLVSIIEKALADTETATPIEDESERG